MTTMMIGIKTGTMASVIQGTVRPRGSAAGRARFGSHVPRISDDDDSKKEGKGYKTVRKKRVCDEYYYYY